jgi:hypothetical protein
MLDYIMKKINEKKQTSDQTELANEHFENEAILECCHLFSEMDELTEHGSELNQIRNIDAVNIALDNDVEIDSIELCVADGRLLDTPMAAIIHSESYAGMYSYDDFYTEACTHPKKFIESDYEYENRIISEADNAYNKYCQYIFQEGLFSSDKISLDDPTIQWNKMVNFGPSNPSDPSSAPYNIKLGVAYECPAPNKILIKQRDTLSVFDNIQEAGVFLTFAESYTKWLEEKGFKIPAGKNVWDVIVPKRILIPVKPVDKFIFFFEAENLMSNARNTDYCYLGYSLPIKQTRHYIGGSELPSAQGASFNKPEQISLDTASVGGSRFVDMKSVIRESYETVEPLERVVQEAISFDDEGDSSSNNADSSTPSLNMDSTSADGGDTPPPAEGDTNNNASAEQVKQNDVSADIANKVSDELDKKNEEQNATPENTIDGTESNESIDSLNLANTDLPDESIETPGDETNVDADMDNEGSIDDKLNALDDSMSDDMDTNADGTLNVQDMSPNDLIKSAEEKIKNMSIAQIQAFLSGGDESGIEDGIEQPADSAVQEAFILTKKNINAELDATLRKCLGDLNNSKLDVTQIVSEFKKDGKKLNRALSKAAKMTDMYNDTERNTFIKLNKCLADLIVIFKPEPDKNTLQTIKRLIKAFTSQATAVGKIVDKHKNDTPKPDKDKKGEAKQEGFIFDDMPSRIVE